MSVNFSAASVNFSRLNVNFIRPSVTFRDASVNFAQTPASYCPAPLLSLHLKERIQTTTTGGCIMTRLEFRQVEKSAGNAVVFPRFDLSV
ncbi:hypothetical protein, partial [Bhargavaea cecembensis]|uniref:hypothetical protein n=1 Tax=Bhargavaea cecembensis TaxID=394098 RepID=UPI00058F67CA